MTIELKFCIHDQVHIKPVEGAHGVVVAIYLGDSNQAHVQYRVRYFDRGDEKSAYFYENELEQFTKGQP